MGLLVYTNDNYLNFAKHWFAVLLHIEILCLKFISSLTKLYFILQKSKFSPQKLKPDRSEKSLPAKPIENTTPNNRGDKNKSQKSSRFSFKFRTSEKRKTTPKKTPEPVKQKQVSQKEPVVARKPLKTITKLGSVFATKGKKTNKATKVVSSSKKQNEPKPKSDPQEGISRVKSKELKQPKVTETKPRKFFNSFRKV